MRGQWERYPDAQGRPTRDYTYSHWHRYALPNWCSMIDVDGLDYCRSCAMPLLLVEVARDVGQPWKPVTALKSLAQTANVPAICILYQGGPCTCEPRRPDDSCAHGIDTVRARRVYPEDDPGWLSLSGSMLRDYIRNIHESHLNSVHRKLGAA